MTGALAGLRVLDLSERLPGGYCTMVMADHGAVVLKVERPGGGDFTRSVDPRAGSMSAIHWILNRNKRSIVVDLKSDAGRRRLHELAVDADVLLEGYRPGVAARLGADYRTLSRINKRLVYCSITGYGQDGALRSRSGHDINYMAYSGALGLSPTGADGLPVMPVIPVADLAAGALTALSGILIALRHRDATGLGQFVDVSMTDGLLSMLPLAIAEVVASGKAPGPGDLMVNGAHACYGAYATRGGGAITLGLLEPEQWHRFSELIGRPEWRAEQLATGPRAAEIRAALAELFMTRTAAEWEVALGQADLCAAPVLSLEEALAHPHIVHRGVVTLMPDRDSTARVQLAPVIRLSVTPGSLRTPAPALGEHDSDPWGPAPDGA